MNTAALIVTAVISFAVSALLGKKLIPFLKKINFGQTIYDLGPKWHMSKQGTPVMGGFMFIIGSTAAVIVGSIVLALGGYEFAQKDIVGLICSLTAALAFGAIGFIDDYIKVVKKRNLGLKAMQKIVMQIAVTVCYLATMRVSGNITEVLTIPFIGQLDLGLFYYIPAAILVIGIVNSVNLTDGIDGLDGSVTFVYGCVFMIIASMLGKWHMSVFSVAVAAGCLGFLVWNFHPAKVFMGDTGSMFLGGAVTAMAFGVDLPILLFVAGMLYCIESLSVILQVISFKTTGKRIFKMSPIHHHFEMCGWSEVKIVAVFSVFTVITGILAIIGAANI